MTTQVRITHLGGSHPVEVVRSETEETVSVLSTKGDEYVNYVYQGQSFHVREKAD